MKKIRKNKLRKIDFLASQKREENYFLFLISLGYNIESAPAAANMVNAAGRNASVKAIDMPADPPRSVNNNKITNIFCFELLRIVSTPKIPKMIVFIIGHIHR
jgi:hypothetical protein